MRHAHILLLAGESIPQPLAIVRSAVRGLHAVSYPIMDSQGHALAALTVPYVERIDQAGQKRISEVEKILGSAARTLTERIGGVAAARKILPGKALPLNPIT